MNHCKRNKQITCAIYRTSRELPEDWFNIEAESTFTRKEFSVNESSSLPGIQHLYVLVSHNGKAVAKAYLQLLSLKKEHLNKALIKKWQYNLWCNYAAVAKPTFLIAGHLFRHDEQFFFYSKHITSFIAYKCYKAAIDEALSTTCASGVLIKDMPEDLVGHFQHHTPGYILLRNDISMEMDIPGEWQGIGDYEKSLKHKYAQRFRKIRQQWQGLEIKELSLNEAEDNKDNLYNLYQQVLKHQQVRLGILSKEFLVSLKACYEDRLKIWAVYDGDKMIAFFSGWEKDDAFDMFYIGFDYTLNAERQSYFNILYFSVEQAIHLGKRKLILGRTALDAKARVGCTPRYLHTFLYLSNPLIRRFVLRKQQSVSMREGDWEEKHPFKAQKD